MTPHSGNMLSPSLLMRWVTALAVLCCSYAQTLSNPLSISLTTAFTVPPTYASTGLTLTVTTTSASDKVVLFSTLNWRGVTATDTVLMDFYRGNSILIPYSVVAMDAIRVGEHFPVTMAHVDTPGSIGTFTYDVRAQGSGTLSQNGNPRTLLAFVVPSTYPAGTSFSSNAPLGITSSGATSLGTDVVLTLPSAVPVLVVGTSPYVPLGSGISMNYATYSLSRSIGGFPAGLQYPNCAVANKRRTVSMMFMDGSVSGTVVYSANARKGHSGTNTFQIGTVGECRNIMALSLPAGSAYAASSSSNTGIYTTAWTAASGLSVTIPGAVGATKVLLTVQAYARSSPSYPTATGHYTIFRNGVNLGDVTVGMQTVAFVTATPENENRDATFFFYDTPPSDGVAKTYTVMARASVGGFDVNEYTVYSQVSATVLSTTPIAPPPTRAPTSAPTTIPYLASPTYTVSPGFAFAARSTIDGMVWTWGQLSSTSTTAPVATIMRSSGSSSLFGSRAAFAHINTDSSTSAFGVAALTAGSATFTSVYAYRFGSIVSNDAAFAGISTSGGKVLAFGSWYNGGDVVNNAHCNGFASQLSSGVVSIVASSAAFAALKADGTVYAWGNTYAGGGVSSLTRTDLVGVQKIFASATAFAALLSSGAVKVWGDKFGGGDATAVASALTSGVQHIIASMSVFVAFKADTSIIVWGNPYYGGVVSPSVIPSLTSGVKYVTYTAVSLAALKWDGSVVAWGDETRGGDTSPVAASLVNIAALYSNRFAFAALTSSGGVVAWGDATNGGVIPSDLISSLSSGVTAIYSTHRAFAALKGATGQLILWGNPFHGADAGDAGYYINSGVRTVCANDAAFTAILQDGRAVAWGHPSSIPNPGLIQNAPTFAGVSSCATGAVRATIAT